jgi:hypothetical protein
MPTRAYTQALKQVRSICLTLPESAEVEAWGHPTFRAGKKMFAAFGEGVEGREGLSLGVKVGFDRQEGIPEDRHSDKLERGQGPAGRGVSPSRAEEDAACTQCRSATAWMTRSRSSS